MMFFSFLSFVFYTITICQSETSDCLDVSKPSRTFEINYDSNQFLKDGKPFRYVSGSLHYFRVPRVYWEDRLKKFKAAGLNAIQTYVAWNVHEPTPGVYDFEGDLDLPYFIQLAQKLDLLVLLRPGPYICAERDLGGYPPWLFTLDPDIQLRTSDKNHTHYVKIWLGVLMEKVKPLLYGNGGPIIMVQVENEYGSFDKHDHVYTEWLRDLYKSHVGKNAVLFTTDGCGQSYVKYGSIPDVFITVDFGPGYGVGGCFDVIKHAGQTKGPLVNSEYYVGWLAKWNDEFPVVSAKDAVQGLKDILDYSNSTSVNMYMFFGGTNFGFTSGATCGNGYNPQITSYDYDAPITEAGDLTDKYHAIKHLLSQYDFLNVPKTDDIQSTTPKANYGNVKFNLSISLFSITNKIKPVFNKTPQSFEALSHPSGFLLYETQVNGQIGDPAVLNVKGLRDRALVFVDEQLAGTLSRFRNLFSIPLNIHSGQKLSLLVENEGRINYGSYINDMKGILCPVLLNGEKLLNWNMVKLPLENITMIEEAIESSSSKYYNSHPAFYTSKFQLQKNQKPEDTYLNLSGWGKGVAFLNGFNLGRYWVATGPQITLYVPGSLFKPHPSENKLTVFELEHVHPSWTAVFQQVPILNSTIPKLGKYNSVCQMQCNG